jgi:acetyl esterase/lipase
VRSPAVLIIHGGGWVNGDKADYRQFNIGTNLAHVGYLCISVNYMMTPGQRGPTNLLDCKNAVRFLRKNAEKYQIDPDHIGVIGGSAGGHLSLMVAYTTDVPELEPQQPYPGISDRVQCVVNLYGITNLLSRQKTDARGNPIGSTSESTALLQKTRPEDPHLWQLASPVYHISAKTPPTLILHGTADTTVDRDQAAELARKLQEANVLHELVMVPGIGHTFDLQTWNHKPLPVDVRGIVIGFFDKHLK